MMDFIHGIDQFLDKICPFILNEISTESRRRHHAPPLKMTAVSTYIPKEKPGKPLGEDAHFFSPKFQTIGVADGVGGWAKKGIDSGKYSRLLMANAFLSLNVNPNPIRVLQTAYRRTGVKGSSTALIITLSGDRLRAVNVGDSGFLVIRDGKVVFRSSKQQRKFNHPYQLGRKNDDPSVAVEMEVAVEEGDVVVAGNDGLLDNMCESEMLKILGDGRIGGLEERCRFMANVALYNSLDRDREDLPFVDAARACGWSNYRGGMILQ